MTHYRCDIICMYVYIYMFLQVEELASLLNNPLIDVFVEALDGLTFPEHKFAVKYHLEQLSLSGSLSLSLALSLSVCVCVCVYLLFVVVL